MPTLVILGIYFVALGAVQSALEEIFVVVAYQQVSGGDEPRAIDPSFAPAGLAQGEIRIND